MKNFILASTGFLLMAAGACLAQTAEPSLADLARERHSAKKASRVITNDDVATASPQARNEQATAKAAPGPNGTAAATGSPAKPSEKSDREHSNSSASTDATTVADLKKKLDSYKEEQDGWKKSAQRYQDLLTNETSDFRRQMYQDALESDKRNVALFQEKIDKTQADLAKAQKGPVSGGSGSN